MLRAGKLNSLVTVVGLGSTRDDWGSQIEKREVLGEAWANIGQLSGKALIKAGAVQASVTTSIRMRFQELARFGLKAGMVIELGGASFAVRVVLPDWERREHVDLICADLGVAGA